MAVSFRTGTSVSSDSATSIVVPSTGFQVGDFVKIGVIVDNAGGVTSISPGTWDKPRDVDTGDLTIAVFTGTLASVEAGGYTVSTTAAAGGMAAIAACFNPGGDTLNAITTSTVASEAGSSTSSQTNSLSGAANPTFAVGFWANDTNVTVATPPGTMTQVVAPITGAAHALAAYYEANVGAGAFQRTLDWSGADQWANDMALSAWTSGASGGGALVGGSLVDGLLVGGSLVQ